MSKIPFFIISSFILTGCFDKSPNISEGGLSGLDKKESRKLVRNNCIRDTFAQGQDKNLFGIECIEGKKLVVKTAKKGKEISTSQTVSEEALGWDLDGKDLDFINKVYDLDYKVLKKKGDDKQIPFLLDFLPLDNEFNGALDTKYEIIFKTMGNYLVLFKASKDIKDLPYTERTSVTKSGDYHMVPFLGYSIEYCSADPILNSQGEETYQHRINCDSNLNDQKYIKVSRMQAKPYEYLNIEQKRDLFPSDYFNGNWFFTQGPVESRKDGELSPFQAFLVKVKKNSQSLDFIEASGNVLERNRQVRRSIPVLWKDFEMAKDGDMFERFGEREHKDSQTIKRKNLQINFEILKKEGAEPIHFLVTNDYFSITYELLEEGAKYRMSFLREKSVDQEGFKPRRWFLEDHNHIFGVLPISPQDEIKEGEFTEEDRLDQVRMIRFNTSLNSEEEKKTKTKTIKWYFSKNSTQEDSYREIARKAISIYNQAFAYIMKGADKQIKIELVETEEKDLGDLRYNIINLVKSEDVSTLSVLLGVAPSYSNANTGQIIGTTSNIVIHSLEDSFNLAVRNYIRYELFQKHKRSKEENKQHVVTPHMKKNIENQCPEVEVFIKQKQAQNLKPRDHLGDKDIILSCGKKISKPALLFVILHEMGHSFGLGHNFKASVDEENYYKSNDEIKNFFPNIPSLSDQIGKTSSVMDYTPSDRPELQYLGKYDLAALRFLYRDQIETKEGGYVSLDIPENPLKQTALSAAIKNKKKEYFHCSDYVMPSGEDIFCRVFDYGSTPLEMVNYYIDKFKRSLITLRYRYDAPDLPLRLPPRGYLHNTDIHNIMNIYYKWLTLRNKYLDSNNLQEKTKYVFNNKKYLEDYKDILRAGLNRNKDYDLFYPVREIVAEFIIDFFFTESMSCIAQDEKNQIQKLNLEDIKAVLRQEHHANLYVEDCYSKQITQFLEDNNLTLMEQRGVENFTHYYSEGPELNKADVLPVLKLVDRIIKYPFFAGWLWRQEPDLFHKFQTRLDKSFLEKSTGITSADLNMRLFLYQKLYRYLKESLRNRPEILKDHTNNYLKYTYSTGTKTDSFYKEISEPLANGLSIEDTGVPFLVKAYKDYQESNEDKNFQDYVIDLNTTLDHTEALKFAIPFNKDTFWEKIILKYNSNIKEIENLNALERARGLSVIEQIKQKDIKFYNDFLRHFILNE